MLEPRGQVEKMYAVFMQFQSYIAGRHVCPPTDMKTLPLSRFQLREHDMTLANKRVDFLSNDKVISKEKCGK